MTATQAGTALLAATGLGCLVLIAAVLTRKLRRDKREWLIGHRRSRFISDLLAADAGSLGSDLRQATGSPPVQAGLASALDELGDGLDGEQRGALRRALVSSGLEAELRHRTASRSAVDRGHAALLLSRLRTEGADELLAPLLADEDADVRLVACAGLGRLGTPAAARALIAGLRAHSLPNERIVERLGASWAVPAMVEALESDRGGDGEEVDPYWRAALAGALGVAADARAEPVLLEMLHSERAQERIDAARALGSCGGRRSDQPLAAALADPAWEVRAQAAKSLGRLGSAAALSRLEACLRDRAWWVRANAAEALAQLGPLGIEALMSARHDRDRFARDRATEVLALHHLAEA